MRTHIFLVAATLLIFAGCTPSQPEDSNRQDSLSETVETQETEEQDAQASDTPEKEYIPEEIEKFTLNDTQQIYTKYYGSMDYNTEIHLIDTESGNDEIFVDVPEMALSVYAIPQGTLYDGHVFFIKQIPESDNPSGKIYSMDIGKKDPRLLEFPFDMPFTFKRATALSPDQTKIAAAYDNSVIEENVEKKFVIFDLLKRTETVVDELEDNEFYSEQNGHVFAGADDYSIEWTDNTCVSVKVFTDDPEKIANNEDVTQKIFKEDRELCL